MALAAAVGGLVIERILPEELAAARARLRLMITTSLAVLLLATLAEIVVRTQEMSTATLGVSIIVAPSVMGRTHIGQILTVRLAMVALGLVLSLLRAAAARALVLVAAVAVAATLSLAGHAADWGDLTLSVAVDCAHAVAASIWIGGLIMLAMTVLRRGASWPREPVAVLGSRFSRAAGFCLLAVVVTGAYNSWAQVGGFSRLWTTSYGRVLSLKLLLVAVVVWLGAVNRYTLLPRLAPAHAPHGVGARLFRIARLAFRRRNREASAPSARGGAAPAAAQSRLAAFVGVEALIGLGVFACTALLGELTPSRNEAFARRSSHVAPVSRSATATSRAGTVIPPPGNAARGRAVFEKYQCATCHAVPDTKFPAPTRPGPSLAGVGARHPGELVESIMNPNAQILDGPGYTDERGRSIMPDYQNLTLGELGDLVEYLKTLGGATPPAAGR
ncbi:MAG TPA: CopD family protein [Methylomirabilota bacterium]|nr:CopD family protein [Methylomirabilota bacterium]